MIFEPVDQENRKYYEELIPGPYRHFAGLPGEILIGAAAEAADLTEEEAEEYAEDEVTPAGIILINLDEPEKTIVDWLYVEEPFREQEIATTLLASAFYLGKNTGSSLLEAKLADPGSGEGAEELSFDSYAESFLVRRGFSPVGDIRHEWFFEAERLKDLETDHVPDHYLIASVKDMNEDLIIKELKQSENAESCFPLNAAFLDQEHSFICTKGKQKAGVLLVEKIGDVYCLMTLTGEEKVRRALISQAVESFSESDCRGQYVHIRSISEEGDRMALDLMPEIPAYPLMKMTALPEDMVRAAAAIEHEEELSRLSERFDREIPDRLAVSEVEYYSGMKIGEE